MYRYLACVDILDIFIGSVPLVHGSGDDHEKLKTVLFFPSIVKKSYDNI